ncbi:hypothetical protein MMPV_001984 [Pyropia vietnamensis]
MSSYLSSMSSKMTLFLSSKASSPSPSPSSASPLPLEPDVEDLLPPERAALATLSTAACALITRSIAAYPSLATDDLVRAAGASAHTRDVMLLCYLRDKGGDVDAAVAALAATLTWRRERGVAGVPASAVDEPAACFPAYILGPACEDRRSGGGGVLVYAPVCQFERRVVERGPFLEALVATCEGLFYRPGPSADVVATAPAVAAPGGGGGGGRRRYTSPLGGRYARRATAVVDFTGWSALRHVDLPLVRAALKVFFAHYPCRHGRILLINYPSSVHAVYRAISPLLGAAVIRQIVWVGGGIDGRGSAAGGGGRPPPPVVGGDVDEPLPVGVDPPVLAESPGGGGAGRAAVGGGVGGASSIRELMGGGGG